MNSIRLLPVVIVVVAALLVFKTVGLVTQGGYVLTGISVAQAAGGGGGGGHAAPTGETVTMPDAPTIEDSAPVIEDPAPTLGESSSGGHGAPAASGHGEPAAGEHGEAAAPSEAHGTPSDEASDHGDPNTPEPPTNTVAAENACAPRPVGEPGTEGSDGQLMVIPGDCPPPVDAIPQRVTADGLAPLAAADAALSEQALLERLGTRRSELEAYEQELAMRASLVDAAEKRIEERATTLEAIEAQIASLVEERKAMEEGQFASIVAMYEVMKPKDAAGIFNALDMEILVRVARMISPRKMAPILAEMDTMRAQELTVRLASVATDPLDQMTPENLAALPQIVGQ